MRSSWKVNLAAAPAFATLILLAACQFGVAPGGGGTGGEGLSGILVDSKGDGMSGAKVRAYPVVPLAKRAAAARADSTTTDAGGRFRFADLPAGQYNLMASHARGDSLFTIFIPNIDFKGSLDLGSRTLLPAATLWVYVNGADDRPVEGATCEIPGSPWRAVSDSIGTCVLEGMAVGVYSVLVTAGGRSVVSDPVELTAGQWLTGCQVTFAENEAASLASVPALALPEPNESGISNTPVFRWSHADTNLTKSWRLEIFP